MSFNVTIVIPVKDGLKWLSKSIPKILKQKGIHKMEILIIDSGSEDGIEFYVDDLSDDRIKYFQINPIDFGHGKTRNLGVTLSTYENLVFTVQDATPANDEWLIELVRPLNDYDLDAVCGKQIVIDHKGKNPLEWYRPIDNSELKIVELPSMAYNLLSSLEKKSFSGWDNVNAIYKKSILINYPFEDVFFGEDAYWANNALINNLKIAYNGKSIVDHYHHYSKDQLFRRYLAEFIMDFELYGLIPHQQKINLNILLSWIVSMLKLKTPILDIPFWLQYNLHSRTIYNKTIRHFKTLSDQDRVLIKSNNNPMSTKNIR
jgi:rhamnosyltransferase